MKPVPVPSGESGDMLTEEPFNILITDLRMPGMDGFELIQKARIIQPGIKTILMTGLVNEEVKEKAMAKWLDGFFPKPLAWGKLFAFLGILSSPKELEVIIIHRGSVSQKAGFV